MCRLLGIAASEPTDFRIVLREAPRSLAALSREHRDGWGLAVFDEQGGGWRLDKGDRLRQRGRAFSPSRRRKSRRGAHLPRAAEDRGRDVAREHAPVRARPLDLRAQRDREGRRVAAHPDVARARGGGARRDRQRAPLRLAPHLPRPGRCGSLARQSGDRPRDRRGRARGAGPSGLRRLQLSPVRRSDPLRPPFRSDDAPARAWPPRRGARAPNEPRWNGGRDALVAAPNGALRRFGEDHATSRGTPSRTACSSASSGGPCPTGAWSRTDPSQAAATPGSGGSHWGFGCAQRPSMHWMPCVAPQQSLLVVHLSLIFEHAGGWAPQTNPPSTSSQ